MKLKDHFKFAKISLKARKKTTRSTIRGISFGLILIMPIVFLATGLFGGISSQLNKRPYAIYTNVQYMPLRHGKTDTKPDASKDNGSDLAGGEYEKDLLAVGKNKVQKIVYEKLASTFANYVENDDGTTITSDITGTTLSIDDKDSFPMQFKYPVPKNTGSGGYYPQKIFSGVTVLDLDKSNDKSKFGYFPKNLLKFVDNSPFVANFDQGFSEGNNGATEVMLSEAFVKALGKTAEDFYGKNITIKSVLKKSLSSIYIDADTDPLGFNEDPLWDGVTSYYLCRKFKVVGIVKEQIFELSHDLSSLYHPFSSGIYFSSASLVDEKQQASEPSYGKADIEKFGGKFEYATMPFSQEQLYERSLKYITVAPIGRGFSNYTNFGLGENSAGKAISNVYYDAKDYADNSNTLTELSAVYKSLVPEKTKAYVTGEFASNLYIEMSTIYKIFSIVMIVFGVFGGIILFAALVNLFNTIMHSVNLRKNYLGVMMAIGAKRKEIPRLYFFETIMIFLRSMIWILLFGGGICVGLKFLIDALMRNIGGSFMGVKISIGWQYLPVSIAIVFTTLFAIGWLFAYGCSRKVAKAPITETLNEGA